MKHLFVISIALGIAVANFDAGFEAYHQKDYPTAIKVWETSCEDGDSRACNVLALMYDNGEYVLQNRATAKTYYKKACDQGDRVGCKFYERIKAQGL